MLASLQVLDHARGVAYAHYTWMLWNLGLAIMPLALAGVLFARDGRAGRRPRPLWWVGAVLFVLFLPNAPYVITDVVHLFDDIRSTDSDLVLLGVNVPVFLAFFATGIGSYVAALELARRFTKATWPRLRWSVVELALHGLCAVGIYLGRVVRLNSWEVLTRPRAVIEGFGWLAGIAPLAIVVCTAGVLLSLTLITRALAWAAYDAAGRLRAELRGPKRERALP
jgi:uncharacterized membrane protein